MNRSVGTFVIAATVGMLSGCSFFFEVPDTRVEAQNDLYDLVVEVNGDPNDVSAVDLTTVVIGDVVFASVPAGETTSSKVTNESGLVDITIAQADVTVETIVLGAPSYTVVTITDIDPMEADIEANETNTVIFDETTAAVVFNGLAKKLPD